MWKHWTCLEFQLNTGRKKFILAVSAVRSISKISKNNNGSGSVIQSTVGILPCRGKKERHCANSLTNEKRTKHRLQECEICITLLYFLNNNEKMNKWASSVLWFRETKSPISIQHRYRHHIPGIRSIKVGNGKLKETGTVLVNLPWRDMSTVSEANVNPILPSN